MGLTKVRARVRGRGMARARFGVEVPQGSG